MPALDQALRVLQDGRLVFHQTIRGQASLALAQAHTAARRVKANAHLGSSLDFVFQAHIVGENVVMVAGGGAAGQEQFSHSKFRSRENVTAAQPRPDWI